MKIVRTTDAAFGRVIYNATPQEYDGIPPVSKIWIDGRLCGAYADRLCIAEAILFHGYIGGPVTFSVPCSPGIASALALFLSPRFAPITALTLANKEPPTGGRIATLGHSDDRSGGFYVALAPEARFVTTYDIDSAVFGSNLRTLRRAGEGDGAVTLALAVLFAEDLSIRRIVIRRSDLQQFGDRAIDGLGAALALTNLTLDIVRTSDAP